ncbi:MAG: dodecin family protein [Pseudomonadota bacterium]
MSVARVTEISAAGASVEKAIEAGVARATDTLSNVEAVWVQDIKAVVKKGKVAEYRVLMKVTFVLQEAKKKSAAKKKK